MPANFENVWTILNSSATGAMQIKGIRDDALKELYYKLFGSDDNPNSNSAVVQKAFLQKAGIYIGGFLYLSHKSKSVDYRFFELAQGKGATDSYRGYMLPYIDVKHRGEMYDRAIDELFFCHRAVQQGYIWPTENLPGHLVPEYLAKSPFFMESDDTDSYLYVEWIDLVRQVCQYRALLCGIAEVDWGINEKQLWTTLGTIKNELPEIERFLIEKYINSTDSSTIERWDKLFQAIDLNKTNSKITKWYKKPDNSKALETRAYLICDLKAAHTNAKFPLIPYLYWNLLRPGNPKTHLVLPIWQDLLNDSVECNRLVSTTGTFEPSRTRITGMAVISVRPLTKNRTETDKLTSVQVAVLLSKFLTLPQVAAYHYDDISKEVDERIKHQRKAAVAAIAAQSLSHNIGSHALSDANLFNPNIPTDVQALKGFHQYLQARLDYVSQLIATTSLQPEPMHLFRDVLSEFFRQRLLLNCLVADRSVPGKNISFLIDFPASFELVFDNINLNRSLAVLALEQLDNSLAKLVTDNLAPSGVIWESQNTRDLDSLDKCRKDRLSPVLFKAKDGSHRQLVLITWTDIELFLLGCKLKDPASSDPRIQTFPLPGPSSDLIVAIPGGSVGCQALFGIFENLMRNSVKYGEKRLDSDKLRISMRLSDPGEKEDYWFLEIWDNFSGFSSKPNAQYRYSQVARNFGKGVIQSDGKPQEGGHGLMEIKEAMRFLHNHSDGESDDCNQKSPWACPACCTQDCLKSESPSIAQKHCCNANLTNIFHEDYGGNSKNGTLVNRIRLSRPRLLGVWSTCDGDERDLLSEGVFYRKTLDQRGPCDSHSLVDLAPHLLVIRDSELCKPKDIVKKITDNHWHLPFRLFIVTERQNRIATWEAAIKEAEESESNFLPNNRLRLICDPILHKNIEEAPISSKGLSYVNSVYDTWLRAYKPLKDDCKKWHLCVSFERGEELDQKWESAHSFESSSASISMFRKIGDKVVLRKGALPHGEIDTQCVLLFSNHDWTPNQFSSDCKDGSLRFYQPFGSTESPRTFNALYSPPVDQESFKFFVFSVIEAALTTVAIFDERVISTAFRDNNTATSHRFSASRIQDFWSAGVIPLLAIPSGTNSAAISRTDVDTSVNIDSSTTLMIAPFKQLGLPGAGLAQQQPGIHRHAWTVRKGAFRSNGDESPPEVIPDVTVIHEGLIEELVRSKCFQEGQDIQFLKTLGRIVRTSGKGRDKRNLNPNHPFAEYSAISVCFTPYVKSDISSKGQERTRIEKLLLTRAVLNCTGTTNVQLL